MPIKKEKKIKCVICGQLRTPLKKNCKVTCGRRECVRERIRQTNNSAYRNLRKKIK